MITEQKTFVKALSIQDAINYVNSFSENCKYIAGGTDIMANKFLENDASPVLIDITDISELKGVSETANAIIIGPLTTLNNIQTNSIIHTHLPAMQKAAYSVGSPLIRSSATLGGNLLCENRCLYYNQSAWWREAVGYCLKCNGDVCIATGGANACFSEFVSDTAPVLICANASLNIINCKGESRLVLLRDIYTGDGVKPRSISNTELITEIIIPKNPHFKCSFNKLRLRETLEFTSLTSAVSFDNSGIVKITLAGMDPKPVYLEIDKTVPTQETSKQLLKLSRAVDNDFFSRKYRRDMVKVFLEKSYKELNIC
ncbi:MAG: FAD binding domain-containing protein [Bacteroidia bacterium]|nr:FAD binding domain-containing protein [Bacteroidia bacterium]